MAQEQLSYGELIKRICDVFEARANKNLQEQDITFSQMKVLVYLDKADDHSATLKEVEKRFGTSQATIAGIAVRLEKKKLIEGYIDADDRRIKHIRLTDAGLTLCREAKSNMEEEELQLLNALEAAERSELLRLLQKVHNGLL